MKKYQLWLERKNYTQHLDNLLRIKIVASERKLGGKINTHLQKTKNLSRYQSQMKLTHSFNGQNLSYIITAKELQNHKLSLVRSKEIVRENEQIVKRINEAKPIVTNFKPIHYSNYKMKKIKERANVQTSFSQKQKNYQHFARFYDGMPHPRHRFQLAFTLQQVQIRMPQRQHQIMLEIIGTQPIAKSEFILPHDLIGKKFQFTFQEQLPEFFTLRLHSYKGLQDTILGDYVIARPDQGQTVEAQWPTVQMPGVIKGKVAYSRLLPKFWPIKRFK